MSKQVEDIDDNIAEVDDEQDFTELLKQIETLQEESNGYKDKYLRSVADLENLKKRSSRDREELRKLLISGFLEEILPVMDGFNVGLESAAKHPETKQVADGFQMVADQFTQFLKRYGIEELNPTGEKFDPNFHECVTETPSAEITEGAVVQVIRIGYTMKERLLRPATVVVSSGAPKTE